MKCKERRKKRKERGVGWRRERKRRGKERGGEMTEIC